MASRAKLGVNIDHVATLRQARGEDAPDPVAAAVTCEKAGAHSIVCHLREDRRHIQDQDVADLKRVVKTRLNLEMSCSRNIVEVALKVRPDEATLVPERRQELTTEGGLDVIKHFRRVAKTVRLLHQQGISVNLFIDPERQQILSAVDTGAEMIEIHTGCYALAKTKAGRQKEFNKIVKMTAFAKSQGLIVNAGHGLNYENTAAVAGIPGIEELNIGHSIIARAVFVGLKQAVRDMLKAMR